MCGCMGKHTRLPVRPSECTGKYLSMPPGSLFFGAPIAPRGGVGQECPTYHGAGVEGRMGGVLWRERAHASLHGGKS